MTKPGPHAWAQPGLKGQALCGVQKGWFSAVTVSALCSSSHQVKDPPNVTHSPKPYQEKRAQLMKFLCSCQPEPQLCIFLTDLIIFVPS